ncbi:zinc metalloproteinase nas-14-like isoform X1 [Diabrotica virgifera virgifera]|uniref:Metalloendopeptidase n=1 Tax=Diabrotica virgifera virgifera TaxID=50390 RepID=A0ABM5JKJ6_DIAVI|nr:zinc metalloproteinase nas-14-like isoform X1 [Diabrotica virgifera virgifera]
MSKHILHVVILVALVFVEDIANKRIKKSRSNVNYKNPEENDDYFEGDIILPQDSLRNGRVGETWRWDQGIIPYQIDENITVTQKEKIHLAIATFHKYTCVTFRPAQPDDKYRINIIHEKKKICASPVGRQPAGYQNVTLGDKCRLGNIIHEFMHVIGFWHEQSRKDRDDHINIILDNIKEGSQRNFEKKDDINFGQMYDYESIMHYHSKAFTKNDNITIIPKDTSFNKKMGQRIGLSKIDITKINLMYHCPEKTKAISDSPTKYFVVTRKEYRKGLNHTNQTS